MVLNKLLVASCLFVSPLVASSGDFGEHKLIGDRAMKQALTNSNYLVNLLTRFERTRDGDLIILQLRDGSPITYGDLCGLAGDHSPNPFDLTNSLDSGTSGQPPTGVIKDQVDLVEMQLRAQWENIGQGGKGVNPFVPSFIQIADEDRSHFCVTASTYRQQLEWINRGMMKVFLESQFFAKEGEALALRTRWATIATFALPAPAKHVLMHQLAQRIMRVADETFAEDDSPETIAAAMNYVRMAFVANAFADHYLQDLFAGGHHMIDRLLADPHVHAPADNPSAFSSIPALETKGIHDYYNRKGVSTTVRTTTVTLYGDGLYTDEQLQLATIACSASLQSLDSAHDTKDVLTEIDNYTIPASGFAYGLAYAPQPLIGNDYATQNTFGRSINGTWYSIGIGTNYNGDVMHGFTSRFTVGLGFEALRAGKGDVGWHEGWLAVSPNASIDFGIEHQNSASTSYVALFPLGIELQFTDMLIAGASGGAILANEKVGLAGRIDAGLQFKLPTMKTGVRIMGSLLTSSGNIPKPAITFVIVSY